MNDSVWQAVLAAWTHDPAEKALILMRGESHEAGTVRALQQQIFGQSGIPSHLEKFVKKADHWASAADRPPFGAGGFDRWAQVRFDLNPELIHPLSGERVTEIQRFDIDVNEIKAVSQDHFSKLIQKTNGEVDPYRTALAFWRFGPEPPAPELGELWSLMPADTRVPDHSIWSHLDLTSAFAAAFAGDQQCKPALIQVSFGPVQDFIAQSRTTSDLWSGSHFLSRVAWEGMRVVCERFGPGAVLFPQLRGVPQVDLWLLKQDLDASLFADLEWRKRGTDANPLFAAALPNKFLALVPESEGASIAADIEKSVRQWVWEQAEETIHSLFDTAVLAEGQKMSLDQARSQLQGFPEVYWSVVPWMDESSGREALADFYPEGTHDPGFFGSEAWQVLKKGDIKFEKVRFFTPNDGTLYPVNYELADRSLAAAKSVRPFSQLVQNGYRCSLCGEREWLTHDRTLLESSPRKQDDSLWARVGKKKLSWARKGEHLCAVCAIKRLWPSRFAEQVADATGQKAHRYVVSTHTMALVNSLDRWRRKPDRPDLPMRWLDKLAGMDQVALPRGLAKELFNEPEEISRVIRCLPALVQHYQDAGEDTGRLDQDLKKLFGTKSESYYALILMDGDRMGSWLSGEFQRITYKDCWHGKVVAGLRQRAQGQTRLMEYMDTPRAVSPGQHVAISSALSGFALNLVPHVVEQMFKGKVLYAGGDDVMAMVSVDDLLPVLTMLRFVYSGTSPGDEAWRLMGDPSDRPDVRNGHVYLKQRLYRVMGKNATASAGAVIAHHQSPLGQVIKELRMAEKRAKNHGRDAFSISVLRRSGGRSEFTSKWHLQSGDSGFESSPMGQLMRARDGLSEEQLSRRTAYILQDWLRQMPDDPKPEMLIESFGYQFFRQGGNKELKELGRELASKALLHTQGREIKHYLHELLAVAEFLAREGRVSQ